MSGSLQGQRRLFHLLGDEAEVGAVGQDHKHNQYVPYRTLFGVLIQKPVHVPRNEILAVTVVAGVVARQVAELRLPA